MIRTASLVLLLVSVGACSKQSRDAAADRAKTAAACSAAETSFGQLANGVIESGVCDEHLDNPDGCPQFAAVSEAYATTMEKLQCPL